MTLNIPLDEMILDQQDIDDNGDDFMNEIQAASDLNENNNTTQLNRRKSLTNAKNKSNLISCKLFMMFELNRQNKCDSRGQLRQGIEW